MLLMAHPCWELLGTIAEQQCSNICKVFLKVVFLPYFSLKGVKWLNMWNVKPVMNSISLTLAIGQKRGLKVYKIALIFFLLYLICDKTEQWLIFKFCTFVHSWEIVPRWCHLKSRTIAECRQFKKTRLCLGSLR